MRRLQVITPLLIGFALAAPAPAAYAQIGIGLSITIAPPVLPIYVQPEIPAPGYMWTPGYWAYGDNGYYWVPGTWVQPPAVGLLWTPGYWGWNSGVYAWNGGYWGPHVGFYGGVNYGFGYTGDGYYGGRWDHGAFAYNRSVNNFGNVHVTNVYNSTVINNNNRVAFNGGNGGIAARPTPQQEAFAHEQHVGATSLQTAHEHTAASNPQLRYTANHGQPPIAATARPGEFTGHGVVAARPAVTPAAVGAHGPTPAVRGATPGVQGAASAVHGPTPAVHGPTPGVQGATPGVHEPTPAVHGAAPAVHGPTSAVHGPTNVAAHPSAVTPHAPSAGPPHAAGPTTRAVASAPHPSAPHPSAPAPHAAPAAHAAPAPKAPPKQQEHKP